jgi:hypothetical protein
MSTSVSGGDSFHASICGASQGGYTANAGTDWHNQLWKKVFVPMANCSEEDHDGKKQGRGGLGKSDCNH